MADLGDTVTYRGAEYYVTDSGKRVVWGDEQRECERCSTTLELQTTHQYVRVELAAGGETETRTYVFCRTGCRNDWPES